MINSEIKSDFIELAQIIVDDLASEIDLHYDDVELAEAADSIAKLETLQSMISKTPSDVCAHIITRYKSAIA